MIWLTFIQNLITQIVVETPPTFWEKVTFWFGLITIVEVAVYATASIGLWCVTKRNVKVMQDSVKLSILLTIHNSAAPTMRKDKADKKLHGALEKLYPKEFQEYYEVTQV